MKINLINTIAFGAKRGFQKNRKKGNNGTSQPIKPPAATNETLKNHSGVIQVAPAIKDSNDYPVFRRIYHENPTLSAKTMENQENALASKMDDARKFCADFIKSTETAARKAKKEGARALAVTTSFMLAANNTVPTAIYNPNKNTGDYAPQNHVDSLIITGENVDEDLNNSKAAASLTIPTLDKPIYLPRANSSAETGQEANASQEPVQNMPAAVSISPEPFKVNDERFNEFMAYYFEDSMGKIATSKINDLEYIEKEKNDFVAEHGKAYYENAYLPAYINEMPDKAVAYIAFCTSIKFGPEKAFEIMMRSCGNHEEYKRIFESELKEEKTDDDIIIEEFFLSDENEAGQLPQELVQPMQPEAQASETSNMITNSPVEVEMPAVKPEPKAADKQKINSKVIIAPPANVDMEKGMALYEEFMEKKNVDDYPDVQIDINTGNAIIPDFIKEKNANKIKRLHPAMQITMVKFYTIAHDSGYDFDITDDIRTLDYQIKRKKEKSSLGNPNPYGTSAMHIYGLAVDITPVNGMKYEDPEWRTIQDIGRFAGLRQAYEFRKDPNDEPWHFDLGNMIEYFYYENGENPSAKKEIASMFPQCKEEINTYYESSFYSLEEIMEKYDPNSTERSVFTTERPAPESTYTPPKNKTTSAKQTNETAISKTDTPVTAAVKTGQPDYNAIINKTESRTYKTNFVESDYEYHLNYGVRQEDVERFQKFMPQIIAIFGKEYNPDEETMMGITQKEYDSHSKSLTMSKASVKNIIAYEIDEILYREHFLKSGANATVTSDPALAFLKFVESILGSSRIGQQNRMEKAGNNIEKYFQILAESKDNKIDILKLKNIIGYSDNEYDSPLINKLATHRHTIKGNKDHQLNQNSYDEYRKKLNLTPRRLDEITKEELFKLWDYQNIYLPAKIDKIEDQRTALAAYHTAIVFGVNKSIEFTNQSGGDVEKYLELVAKEYKKTNTKNRLALAQLFASIFMDPDSAIKMLDETKRSLTRRHGYEENKKFDENSQEFIEEYVYLLEDKYYDDYYADIPSKFKNFHQRMIWLNEAMGITNIAFHLNFDGESDYASGIPKPSEVDIKTGKTEWNSKGIENDHKVYHRAYTPTSKNATNLRTKEDFEMYWSAGGDADETIKSFYQLDPLFQLEFLNMIDYLRKEKRTITINTPGCFFRTFDKQVQLYKNNLKANDGAANGMVARPGKSKHEIGAAADIVISGTEWGKYNSQKDWIYDTVAKWWEDRGYRWGMSFKEKWHFDMNNIFDKSGGLSISQYEYNEKYKRAVAEHNKNYGINRDKKRESVSAKSTHSTPKKEVVDMSDKNVKSSRYEMTLQEAVDKQAKDMQIAYKNGNWIDANKNEILEYLDPNRYNDGVYRYQFLDLSAPADISESDMAKFLNNKGILSGKEKVYLDAAKKYGISEVYLAAHSALETGNGKSKLATGVVVDGVTVYNMYGIGAFDGDAVNKGARFAYEQGWDTPEKAIDGGAKWISEQYINNPSHKQNTLYKMKWNPAKPGRHEYATDIGWAVKQTKSIKKLYDDFPNATLKFDVPVYKEG